LKEKELRLALVCFGGISLAIYMHGVSKEILKLARASKLLYGVRDRNARQALNFGDLADRADPEFDSERIYFDLLKMISREVELRVVVDVIAGASAGGINSVILARALAHNLPIGQLRDFWLNEADVTGLVDESARAKVWSKFFMRPLIWALSKFSLFSRILDSEMRFKLSVFVRSRWFKPPFSGLRMSRLLIDAMHTMSDEVEDRGSLLPVGHRLELFVTVTDFYGYQRPIIIHDPPLIREREHRHVLRFAYQSFPNGDVQTDFTEGDIPALAFAARATSSYPGAFPPAQIREIDDVMEEQDRPWIERLSFLTHNFEAYSAAGADPTHTAFVDGAVLNNKPFKEAISAIQGRPAYREVDRRLVYIDPDPGRNKAKHWVRAPGFFVTIKGALSDIPRNEPIGDELAQVGAHNEYVARQKAIIESARPSITRLVAAVQPANVNGPLSSAEIAHWREAANESVKISAGFAYEGYVRLKFMAVQNYVGDLIATLVGAATGSAHARWIEQVILNWCKLEKMSFDDGLAFAQGLPPWVGFLLAFDVDFRRRRLQFLIRGQNRLYSLADGESYPLRVDQMKRRFYDRLDELRRCDLGEPFSDDSRMAARALLGRVIPPMGQVELEADALQFTQSHHQDLTDLINRLKREFNLDQHTSRLDELIAEMDPEIWPQAARFEIMVNYIGFSYWDVLTLSISNWRDLAEFDEIKVDRISPEDARACRRGTAETLRGNRLAHFGAFFSRSHRENDYLWGRLHSADRLIDIVCDSAGIDPERADIIEFKARAFSTIIDSEEPHLSHVPDLFGIIRADIAALRAGTRKSQR
jgi:patatin-related protein